MTTNTERARLILLRLQEPRKGASKADAYWLCEALISAEAHAEALKKEAQHWRGEAAHYATAVNALPALLDLADAVRAEHAANAAVNAAHEEAALHAALTAATEAHRAVVAALAALAALEGGEARP